MPETPLRRFARYSERGLSLGDVRPIPVMTMRLWLFIGAGSCGLPALQGDLQPFFGADARLVPEFPPRLRDIEVVRRGQLVGQKPGHPRFSPSRQHSIDYFQDGSNSPRR